SGSLCDAGLQVSILNGLHHAAVRIDLLDDLANLLLHAIRQPLDEIASAEGIDRSRNAGLVSDDLLRAQSYLGADLRRNLEGFVVGAGEDGLSSAEHRRQRLRADPH